MCGGELCAYVEYIYILEFVCVWGGVGGVTKFSDYVMRVCEFTD